MSENYVAGFIGVPNLNMFTDWMNFDWNSFVFQLVFCATAATIVSGSMAERTKFSAYCVYSAIISPLFTRLKQVGFGTVRVGLHSSVVLTLQVQS